jgi:hypothetical protein
MVFDLVLYTCHHLRVIKLRKLILGDHFITNTLVAKSSLSTCEDALNANVSNDDRFEYSTMFLRDRDFSERALILLLI